MGKFYKTTPDSSFIAVLIFFLFNSLIPLGYAGVVHDGTVGTAGSLTGPNYLITADRGTTFGNNLFHSFSTFGITRSESATFSGPNSISNIISRVTGESSSTIDGRLSSTIGGANMYLINPTGIIFGPNATLEVSGSFHASTADYLKFSNGNIFSATNPSQSILTSAPPSAFGFLSAAPASISVLGSGSNRGKNNYGLKGLSVTPGKEVSLIGGNISLTTGKLHGSYEVESRVSAPGGRINLVSVASPGEVILSEKGVDVNSFTKLGNIDILKGSVVSVSGTGPGAIYIRGGNLTIDSGNLSPYTAATGGIFAASSGDATGGGIDIRLSGDLTVSKAAGIASRNTGAGVGGNISITAPRLTMSDGGWISTSADDIGKGGSITVSASDSVDIKGRNTMIASDSNGTGDGGNISITAPRLTMSDGSQIRAIAFDIGKGGSITVSASDSVDIKGSGPSGATSISTLSVGNVGRFWSNGDGGNISITAPRLTMSDGSLIIAAAFSSSGKGGSITVSASDSVDIKGSGPSGATGISAESWGNVGSGLGASDGGNITITAPRLTMSDGGKIKAGTHFSGGKGGSITVSASDSIDIKGSNTVIASDSNGIGDGGNISITAPRLSMSDGSLIIVSAFDIGKGGSITVSASDSVDIKGNNTGIAAQSVGTGDGGNISIAAPRLSMSDGGGIDATAFNIGKGGSITVSASDSVDIKGSNTYIGAQSQGTGDGGNISITAPRLSMSDGGGIDATALNIGKGGSITVSASDSVDVKGSNTGIMAGAMGAGAGGSIFLHTPTLTMSDSGEISASTQSTGAGGNINVNTNILNLTTGAKITSESTGTGNAGNISVSANDKLFMNSGKITTGTTNADGGNITISSGRLIDMIDSDITATVGGGTGNGGNISMDSHLIVVDPSNIIAKAEYGSGGNITITCDAFVIDPHSVVSASSRYGNSGNVRISSPVVDLVGNLRMTPGGFLGANILSPLRCIPLEAEDSSTFRIVGREGLPPPPDSDL